MHITEDNFIPIAKKNLSMMMDLGEEGLDHLRFYDDNNERIANPDELIAILLELDLIEEADDGSKKYHLTHNSIVAFEEYAIETILEFRMYEYFSTEDYDEYEDYSSHAVESYGESKEALSEFRTNYTRHIRQETKATKRISFLFLILILLIVSYALDQYKDRRKITRENSPKMSPEMIKDIQSKVRMIKEGDTIKILPQK